jgi:Tfp pilus assembly PilM family ATPase
VTLRSITSRYSPIGLDIGARTIKAVQVSLASPPQIVNSAIIPRTPDRPFDAREAQRVRDSLRRRGFAGTRVTVAARASDVASAVVDVPVGAPREVQERICHAEIARLLHARPESLEAVCWPIPSGAVGAAAMANSQMLVMALAHTASEQLIEALEAATLSIERVDIGSVAVAEACEGATATQSLVGVIDIGWDTGTMTFAINGSAVYERRISSCGVRTLTDAVAARKGMSKDDALSIINNCTSGTILETLARDALCEPCAAMARDISDEVSACVEYLLPRVPGVENVDIVLAGGGAEIPLLDNAVRQVLDSLSSHGNIAVRIAQPPFGAKPGVIIAASLAARAFAVRTPKGVAA